MKSKKDNKPKIEPTRAEMEILQLIWQYGPSTVRFVNDTLNESRKVNYTTTLRVMQIMADKGILLRDESDVKHIYRPAEDENKTKNYLLDRFVNTMFNGSVSKLLMQWMGNKKTSKEELDELKKLIKNKTDK